MKLYGKTEPTFWTGETGRLLRGHSEAQTLGHYLISCHASNMIGLYYVGLPTICYEVGLTEEGASKALQSLFEADFATYDRPSGYVYVKNMARIQIGETLHPADKRHKGVINLLKTLRKSPFFLDFYHDYQERFVLPDVSIFKAGTEATSKGLPRTFQAPSKPVAVAVAEKIKTPVAPRGGVSIDEDSVSDVETESLASHSSSDALSDTFNTTPQVGGVVESASESVSEPSCSLTSHASVPVHEVGKTAKGKAKKTALPEGFGLTDELRAWAKTHGHDRLDERMTHFTGYAIANGARYANWTQAFMNAVRDDWAKLNGKRQFGGAPAVRRPAPVSPVTSETEETTPREIVPCPPELVAAFHGVGLGFLTENAGGVL